jgi:hypothetical protein
LESAVKSSFIIRAVLAAVATTFACVATWNGLGIGASFFSIAWLLVVPRKLLTQKIPRNELWITFAIVFAFIAIILTPIFLHFRLPEPHGLVLHLIALAIWFSGMLIIYLAWRKERQKRISVA